MHVLFGYLNQLLAPIWHLARTRPWLSAGVLGLASAFCFWLEIPYLRTFLALAASSVIIAKAEADRRAERRPEADPALGAAASR